MIKLAAIDIDGTLINSRAEVTPRTKAAIREVAARGVQIVIATGRRFCSAKRVVDALEVDMMIAGHNGAILKELDGRFITGCFLDSQSARRAVAVMKSYGLEPIAYSGTGDHPTITVENPRTEKMADYIDRNRNSVEIVDVLELAIAGDVLEVLAIAPGEMAGNIKRTLLTELPRRVEIITTMSLDGTLAFMGVANSQVGKHFPLKYLSVTRGIPPEEMIAFGDNFNDLPMLEYVGTGVVMANAQIGLDREKFLVAPSNDEDGVAVILEELIETGRI